MLRSEASSFSDSISVKVGILFSKLPITANQWTVLSIVPAILGFFALAVQHDMLLALGLFLISGFIDIIDGAVARVTGSVSNLGAYLDGMMDRFVEGFLFFGLMFFGLPKVAILGYPMEMWPWLVLLLFVGSGMVSFSRAYADHRKVLTDPKKLKAMGGILERAERLILVFAGMIVFPYYPSVLNAAIIAAALLSCVTLFQRMWFVVKNAE